MVAWTREKAAAIAEEELSAIVHLDLEVLICPVQLSPRAMDQFRTAKITVRAAAEAKMRQPRASLPQILLLPR